jgi:FtsH-binding integral membrane protein
LSRLDARRLRAGEIIAGASATLLLILLFAVQWYAVSGPVRETLARGLHEPTTFNGWDGLEHLRWLLLVTILVALALTFFQAAREGPAIPITLSVILTVLAGLSTVALIIRVLIKTPGHMLDQRAGAYLGLAATIGITYGAFKSMREEGGTDPAVLDIETIRLQNGP